MFTVSEAEAAAIRAAYERGGELAAAVELRRYFAGIDSTAQARKYARIIARWEPCPREWVGRQSSTAMAGIGDNSS